MAIRGINPYAAMPLQQVQPAGILPEKLSQEELKLSSNKHKDPKSSARPTFTAIPPQTPAGQGINEGGFKAAVAGFASKTNPFAGDKLSFQGAFKAPEGKLGENALAFNQLGRSGKMGQELFINA
jgi:hypothetical protein